MEALVEMTRHINTFVRFFESINGLFCHMRWLESNIRNSSSGLLLAVGGILLFCLYLFGGSTVRDILGISIQNDILIQYGPILIVLVVLGVLFMRRQSLGPQHGVGFDNIMFGRPREYSDLEEDRRREDYNDMNRKSTRNPNVHVGVPISPPTSDYR
eukprot:gene3919-7814_t